MDLYLSRNPVAGGRGFECRALIEQTEWHVNMATRCRMVLQSKFSARPCSKGLDENSGPRRYMKS